MLGIGRGESYVIKQSGLWIQRDHTLDLESVLLADGVKGRVLIARAQSRDRGFAQNGFTKSHCFVQNWTCSVWIYLEIFSCSNWICSEWICSEITFSQSPQSQTGFAQNGLAKKGLAQNRLA
jgi:hypothetical protein